jgi:hypothetical protein
LDVITAFSIFLVGVFVSAFVWPFLACLVSSAASFFFNMVCLVGRCLHVLCVWEEMDDGWIYPLIFADAFPFFPAIDVRSGGLGRVS